MSHEKDVLPVTERLQSQKPDDIETGFLDQALDLLSDGFKFDSLRSLPGLPPGLDNLCISILDKKDEPAKSAQPESKTMMDRLEELCRCVAVIPPSEALFPNLYLPNLVCNLVKKDQI